MDHDYDEATSQQKLGDATVLVCFNSDGVQAFISGALVQGEFVGVEWFSAHVVRDWRKAIEAELARDRADFAAAQCDLLEAA